MKIEVILFIYFLMLCIIDNFNYYTYYISLIIYYYNIKINKF